MDISYFIICVFALLINKVSLQIVGVIGRSTILPCFSNDNGNKHTEIDVRWRHNGLNVCDITKDKCSEEHQEPDYRNRAEVFPEEFVKGNFSLKLSNLMPTDAGEYQCFIIHSPALLVKVQLRLNGSEADKGDPTTETTPMWMILIPVFIIIIVVFLLSVGVIVIKRKKRCYKSSGSGVSANGGHLSNNDSRQPLSNTTEPANQNHQDFSGLQNNK